MKKITFIVSAIVFWCCTSSTNNYKKKYEKSYNPKIETMYEGFFSQNGTRNKNLMMFTIKNKTNDTLYLSYYNFKIDVYKNNSFLEEEKPTGSYTFITLVDCTFLADNISKLKPDEVALRAKKVELLKRAFAEKLYRNYVKQQKLELSEDDKANFLNSVYGECIIIFPKEIISQSFLFLSSSLNHDCKADLRYLDSGVFTTFFKNSNAVKIIY